MKYVPGTLVEVRSREWVVLPESSEELLMLRPLGGMDDEITGVYIPLEEQDIKSAEFTLPNTRHIGDNRSGRLLRDAVRLGFRSSSGPFRCAARIAVEPRPYQLVPLLMALKLDPIRLLIADDVGIGKTIEAALIVRELIDRGEIERFSILCPPQLADQWQRELKEKFHIDAELVLPTTVSRLERYCTIGHSLFKQYPYTIVSLDYIKSDRHRNEFLRDAPECIIVDEAHAAVQSGMGTRHQRYQLVSALAENLERHLILVTATPHSGNENAFRSLLSLLKPEFIHLPEDISGEQNESTRRELARFFIQRKRADILNYLGTDTVFPEPKERDETYNLAPQYKKFFEKILSYARETVKSGEHLEKRKQRIRWWSALALLRSLASSPAAAAETLRNRAETLLLETSDEVDISGARAVLDLSDEENSMPYDGTPGADISEDFPESKKERERLLALAKEAESMAKHDEKLQTIEKEVAALLKGGFNPILFCRFIHTAEYVSDRFRKIFPKVEVACITGRLSPDERENAIAELPQNKQRVLVCTDCLSEGINLQEHFDSVIHYDLPWNPARLEQREGRVDRFGQKKKEVRVLTYWGKDNQIDGIVLDVLLKKHRRIRTDLGVSVPVPANTNEVIEAILEGLILREQSGGGNIQLAFEELMKNDKMKEMNDRWSKIEEREKKSRASFFTQQSIHPDKVAEELSMVRKAIGSGVELRRFLINAFRDAGALVEEKDPLITVKIATMRQTVKELVGEKDLTLSFDMPTPEEATYISRTHPIVEQLSSYLIETALDVPEESAAKRAGVITTGTVKTRTTLMLLRFRYQIIMHTGEQKKNLLVEDCKVLGFRGAPERKELVSDDEAQRLLMAEADNNTSSDVARTHLERILAGEDHLISMAAEFAKNNAEEILKAHRTVREASRQKNLRYEIDSSSLRPDILGIYVFLPSQE